MIPDTERRYTVDQATGTVHKPYVDHAAGLPRTSFRGILSYTSDPVPCSECWPPAPPEPAGYYCLRCERRHYEGSAIYDKHLEPETVAAETDAAPEPEPYFPPYENA